MRRAITFGCFILLVAGVISCEKDFTDIASSVINNNEFTTKDTVLDVFISEKPVTSVRADGIELGGALGQYLLGVYNNPNYEKIEASIISQLLINPTAKLVDKEYGADTTVVTMIDTVYLKLPYQATLKTDGSNEYELDSIIGDVNTPFNLNIYEITKFLNVLDPMNPSQSNSFQSDVDYQPLLSPELNATSNYQFTPKAGDTMIVVNRKLHTGAIYDKDTIKLTNSSPFARIPLKTDLLRQMLLDKYETADFSSQEAFNDYFRGLLLQASGNAGSLLSLNFNTPTIELNPSIEVHYTNTVLELGVPVDTIKKTDSFRLSGVRNNIYGMNTNNPSPAGSVQIQGTAGTHAEVTFGADANNNQIADALEGLRTKNWLINDATLTFYVNQDIVGFDTIATPFRLFLYKDGESLGLRKTLIKDVISEGSFVFGGFMDLSDDKKPDKYAFKITDYVSDLLSGATNYLPPLRLKVANPTDYPTLVTDTVVRTYNWNPKAVMILDHSAINGDRRVQLKISYSEKITN